MSRSIVRRARAVVRNVRAMLRSATSTLGKLRKALMDSPSRHILALPSPSLGHLVPRDISATVPPPP